jgi:hypothetical protein
VRVGHSAAADAATAGAEAADQATHGEMAKLVMVFCAAEYAIDDLLDGVCTVVPDDVPIVGGTTDGEIAAGVRELSQPGFEHGVVVIALGGPGFTVNSLVITDASSQRHLSGAAAAAVVEGIDAPNHVMIMLADGLTREQHELVRGAYSVLGLETPIVGGCSADSLAYELTYQFHGSGAGVTKYVDSIVAVGLGSTAPIGIGIAHGWVKQGEPMIVTSSNGGEVMLLDGEPAADVYLRRIGETKSLLDDPHKFRERAFERPLGMSRRSGEDLRVVHAADTDSGSLLCLADVPQGALVWTMSTDVDSLVKAAADSCRMSVQALGDNAARGLLVFDCGARKLKLGPENIAAELSAIGQVAGGAPFGGFYTYGEIGRIQGARGMHHLTVVALALA